MATKAQPLLSSNPYQNIWKIKVLLTGKGTMHTYTNARGEGCVFNVELTDEAGTQMQATMFNDVARKFFDKFELGKVYYISKGTIKVANKQFRTVENDYEMTLTQYSQVKEAINETMLVPERKFSFVPIDKLGAYVNEKGLVDVIGVVEHVAPTSFIKRKINQQTVPKRDITIVDETKKSVVVCLWNDQATSLGQEILDIADKSPVVAFKSLKIGDFQGVSLSTIPNSYIRINPDIPQCLKLRSWQAISSNGYDSEGKETTFASIGSGSNHSIKRQGPSMYYNRVTLAHITANPTLGDDKPVFFNTRACMTFINPDQSMSYRACTTCKKKVDDSIGSGYWCERCQNNQETCKLRYRFSAKFSDVSGEAWFSVFDEHAETILGCSEMKEQEEGADFRLQLEKAKWIPFVFRVAVSTREYANVKRKNINVIAVAPVDFAEDARLLLEDISKMLTNS